MSERRGKPTPPFGVLVFPGGTELGLEVRRSLRDLKEVRLAGAGSADDIHGPFAYRRWAVVPSVHEPEWLSAVNEAIRDFEIDFVIPGHDDALLALAEHADGLDAALITSPVETCRITRSKRATYERLAGVVPVPRLYATADEVESFPVFAKPDRSQGSRGARVVRDADELARALAAGSEVVMDFLPGEEFTVDCFSDREHGLLFARARSRVRVRAGISMSSRTAASDERASRYAEAIAGRLSLHGAWFFQLREDVNGEPRLLEVAPRLAGTSAVHRVTGVNFALLSLYEQLRAPLRIATNQIPVELDRALVNRYRHDLHYSAVYVDLDDTLVVRDAVHTQLVAFLFQCLNEGCRLVLLTRHHADLDKTLARFRLTGLWDRIVRIGDTGEKADFIEESDAILVDDSFRERLSTHQRLGIATFDSSMLELLLDDRV